jgi:hypothetical protein
VAQQTGGHRDGSSRVDTMQGRGGGGGTGWLCVGGSQKGGYEAGVQFGAEAVGGVVNLIHALSPDVP